MKSRNRNIQLVVWGLSLLPLVMAAVCYPSLPDKIPTNWGLDGHVTYGGKSTIFMLTGLALLLGVIFYGVPLIDPKKDNYTKFRTPYLYFRIAIQTLLVAVTVVILIESYHPGTVNVPMIVTFLCGTLFLVIGIVMPRFQQNFFFGFRTPWALTSEAVWNKIHRLGGHLMFLAGVISMVGAFVPDDRWKMILLLVPVLVSVIIPCIMSYVWFEQLPHEKGN